MAAGDQLVLALASLRDSVARISIRADNEDNAFRATAQRLRCNQLRKLAVIRDAAGKLPDVPPSLIELIFRAGGKVSAADPDDDAVVEKALDEADGALTACAAFLDAQRA